MNPFAWNDQHSVGLPEIDSEHRALFRIAEQLYDEIKTGTAEEGLGGLLARLTSYSGFHFESEEALMRRTGFPEYPQHRREHQRFISTVSSLEALFRSGNPNSAADLMEFLRCWLTEHVCGADRRLAEYIVRQGR